MKRALIIALLFTKMFFLQHDSVAEINKTRVYASYIIYFDIRETSYEEFFGIIKEFSNSYGFVYHLSVYDIHNTDLSLSLTSDEIEVFGSNNDITAQFPSSATIFYFAFFDKINNEKSKTQLTTMVSVFRELMRNSPSINILMEENDIK